MIDPEKANRVKDVLLVTWLEDDPEDPRNWSTLWRWCKLFDMSHKYITNCVPSSDITAVVAIAVVAVAFASAVVSGDFKDIEEEFHVGEVVTALSVSLMVVGFGYVFYNVS